MPDLAPNASALIRKRSLSVPFRTTDSRRDRTRGFHDLATSRAAKRSSRSGSLIAPLERSEPDRRAWWAPFSKILYRRKNDRSGGRSRYGPATFGGGVSVRERGRSTNHELGDLLGMRQHRHVT